MSQSKDSGRNFVLFSLIVTTGMIIGGYYMTGLMAEGLRTNSCQNVEPEKFEECRAMAIQFADFAEPLRIGMLILIPAVWIVGLIVAPRLINKKEVRKEE